MNKIGGQVWATLTVPNYLETLLEWSEVKEDCWKAELEDVIELQDHLALSLNRPDWSSKTLPTLLFSAFFDLPLKWETWKEMI
jgi:hypothetical protein